MMHEALIKLISYTGFLILSACLQGIPAFRGYRYSSYIGINYEALVFHYDM